MTMRASFQPIRRHLWIVLIFCLSSAVLLAETNSGASEASSGNSQETLRSYLQIQEQLHNTQQAIEKNRKEAEAVAAQNSEIMESRLKLLETSMNTQRLNELKEMQNSNRLVLIAAGIFIVVGFLVLLFTAFMQWNTMNRLAAAGVAISGPRALGAGPTVAALGMGMGQTQLVPNGHVERTSAQFAEVLDRLEKRIREMESSLQAPKTLAQPNAPEQGDQKPDTQTQTQVAAIPETVSSTMDETANINLLLGKGQTLLKLDQAEDAVACFDEVLAIDPENAEALVKKGTALERLQKLDEAIACYDQALAADSSMTMAYLYKGGVYNRLERYSEALECYEKALQTQEKSHAA
jgi:tetratricopeptide (TPR) repeat protein